MPSIGHQRRWTTNLDHQAANMGPTHLKGNRVLKIPSSLIRKELHQNVYVDVLPALTEPDNNPATRARTIGQQPLGVLQAAMTREKTATSNESSAVDGELHVKVIHSNLQEKKSRQQLYMRMKNRNPFENYHQIKRTILS